MSFNIFKPDFNKDSIIINKENLIDVNKILLVKTDGINIPWLSECEALPFWFKNISANNIPGKVILKIFYNNKYIDGISVFEDKLIFNFDPIELIDSLRPEEYCVKTKPALFSKLKFHYHMIPPWIRKHAAEFISKYFRGTSYSFFSGYPISRSADLLIEIINNFFNKNYKENLWPDNKKYAVVITHDIESFNGQHKVKDFVNIINNYGYKSSWNVVFHLYKIDFDILDYLKNEGFEIASHGYNHDNQMPYLSDAEIRKRIEFSLERLKRYDVKGFRSPGWYRTDRFLNILSEYFEYDTSCFDTDIFSLTGYLSGMKGVCTVFQYFINNMLEIPTTIPFEAPAMYFKYDTEELFKFHIQKIELIKNIGGVVNIQNHPEHWFSGGPKMLKVFEDLLRYIKEEDQAWVTTPLELKNHWVNKVNS